jgi:hypothetical protein
VTKDKDEKAVIRARMAKTGESYTTAKAQLNRVSSEPAPPTESRQLVMTHRAGEALHLAGRMSGGPWSLVRALRATDGTRGTASHVLAELGVSSMSYEEVAEVRSLPHKTGAASAQFGEIIAAAAELANAEGRQLLDSGTMLRACAGFVRPGDVAAEQRALASKVAASDLAAMCRATEEREGPENELSKDGPGLFSRYTDRSRVAVVAAQEEARGLRHNWIGTEHLLLGLLKEGGGLAATALLARGVALESLRERVVELIGDVEVEEPDGHIPFTPRSKTVLEMAANEAEALGEESIGTHHLLLALVSEGEGIAAQILSHHGLTAEDWRSDVLHLIERLKREG